jgi:hypothetical protein
MRRMTCCHWLLSLILLSCFGARMQGQDPFFGPGVWKDREPSRAHRALSLGTEGRFSRTAAIPGALAGDVFIGEANGMRLHTLSAAERARSPGLLHPAGDGGGGDVSDLLLIQDRFLDSQCGFPPECEGPCNVVIMVFDEITENTAGVDILVDGQLLGTAPGIPAAELPATHVVFITGVPAGLHVFRAAGTTSDEAGIMVLDGQPFKDVSEVMCRQGDAAGDGTCDVLVEWVNAGPFAVEIGVAFDGVFLGTIPGVNLGVTIPDAAAGEHCVEVFGVAPFGEGSDAIYRGCFLETCCTVTCERPDCQPPKFPLVCQVNYGPNDADNIVIVSWANGETPYAVGVNILVDDASRETLEGDDEVTALNMLAAGPHEFGIQGDCGPVDGLSTITEVIFPILSASPHPSPITGAGVTCEFTPDPDGDGPELSATTATWAPDDPSNFIDVYVIRDTLIAYIATIPGNATGVEVTDTFEGDIISLQFFATVGGNCYGSPFFQCAPTVPTGNRYMQGLCNGTGTSPQITSAVFFLNYLFVGGGAEPPCLKACDSNGDGSGNLTDAVYVLSYLFSGGPPPTLWIDSDDDGAEDPTCTLAAPEDDCAASHEVCG